MDDPKYRGRRKVDVLTCCLDSIKGEHVRICIEAKKGYKLAELYNLSMAYFNLDIASTMENTIFAFICSNLDAKEYIMKRLQDKKVDKYDLPKKQKILEKLSAGDLIILDGNDLSPSKIELLSPT